MKAKYAILENKDCWQMPMILQLSPPYLLGLVFQAATHDKAAEILENIVQKRNGGAKILGYRIYVAEAGSLVDYQITPANVQDFAKIYREMADFYMRYKVMKKPYAYKRYKEEF